MIYLELFLSFIKIGAFSFGGGYAAIPLIQSEVVDLKGWLSPSEFRDLITISQMTPGPIAINSATFTGIRIAGAAGALAATLGYVLPPCILVTAAAALYMKYKSLSVLQSVLHMLRPAVVAMIAAAGIRIFISTFWGDMAIALSNVRWHLAAIFAVCMVLLLKYKKNPVFVMVLSGVLNVIYNLIF